MGGIQMVAPWFRMNSRAATTLSRAVVGRSAARQRLWRSDAGLGTPAVEAANDLPMRWRSVALLAP